MLYEVITSTHGTVSDEENDSMTLGAETLVPKNFAGISPKLVYFDSCGLGVSLEFIDVFRQAGTLYYLGPIWSNEAGNSSTVITSYSIHYTKLYESIEASEKRLFFLLIA